VVQPDLSVPQHPEVFVVGDMAAAKDPRTGALVPGVAQGAMQGGRHAARIIAGEVEAKQTGREAASRSAFTYVDKGNMATIGRYRAVADIAGRRLRGFVAWLIWSFIHVLFLINFRSRLAVMFSWVWTYVFFDRGARLITGNSELTVVRPGLGDAESSRAEARAPVEKTGASRSARG
jgi:NADH dehydrogenase